MTKGTVTMITVENGIKYHQYCGSPGTTISSYLYTMVACMIEVNNINVIPKPIHIALILDPFNTLSALIAKLHIPNTTAIANIKFRLAFNTKSNACDLRSYDTDLIRRR
jgi:hypothetical protein